MFATSPRLQVWLGRWALAVLAGVACFAIYRAGSFIHLRHRQNVAMHAVEELRGGCVVEDHSPQWLRKWIGEESARMDEIVELQFGHAAAHVDLAPFRGLASIRKLDLHRVGTDANLYDAAQMPGLEIIDLQDSHVTDGGLASLEPLQNLRELSLVNTAISDAGMASVGKLKRLERFYVSNCRSFNGSGLAHLTGVKLTVLEASGTALNDAGIEHLAKINSLKRLAAADTRVTDAGAANLAALPELTILFLDGTAISDAGLRHIAMIKTLESLTLCHNDIGDPGVTSLAQLPNVRSLNLNGTHVTDAGLRALEQSTKLAVLQVNPSRVTAAGVAELRRALPNTQIADGVSGVPASGDASEGTTSPASR